MTAAVGLERACDRFLLKEYAVPGVSAAFVRILFASWLLAAGAGRVLTRSATIPASLWDPPLGPLRLIQHPPASWFVTIASIATTVALVLLFVGYRTSLASAASGTLLLAGDAIKNSYGKIDHGLTLIALFLILMAASGWGSHLSLDRVRHARPPVRRHWPVAISMLFLSVMMAMAALPKLTSHWLDPSFSAIQVRQFRGVVGFGADAYLAERFSRLDGLVFWEALDWITILFELAFILVVWKRSRMRRLLTIAAIFHLFVLLTLNISFAGIVFVYAAAFDWSRTGRALERQLTRLSDRVKVVGAWSTGISLAVVGRAFSAGSFLVSETPLFVAAAIAAPWLLQSVVGGTRGELTS